MKRSMYAGRVRTEHVGQEIRFFLPNSPKNQSFYDRMNKYIKE